MYIFSALDLACSLKVVRQFSYKTILNGNLQWPQHSPYATSIIAYEYVKIMFESIINRLRYKIYSTVELRLYEYQRTVEMCSYYPEFVLIGVIYMYFPR